MKSDVCPDPETLELLLLGKLPVPQREQLEEHLLTCDVCAASAETVAARDALTDALESSQVLQGDEDVLARVIERGKELRSEVETVQSEETLVVTGRERAPGSETPLTPAEAKVPDEDVDFLNPAEQPDEIGRLGGYRVLEVMGVGGMGVVFRAEDPRLGRQVALKAMKPAMAASRSARERFLREAQATATVEHDNIVQIFQVDEDRNVPFIAMQYLRGESLQTRLKREGRLKLRDVLWIGRQVSEGLAAAHARGLIHRDIKPDNVWVEEGRERVRILDFGLARTHDKDAGLTQTGMVLGTPRYMAPEQARGEPLDHRCDLFSLGSVLYHLVSGKAPFAGGNLTATLIAVSQANCTPIEAVCPDLDPDLAALISGLLSKDPAQRPQTATEVAETLAGIERKLEAEEEERRRQQEETPTIVIPSTVTAASTSDDAAPPRGARLRTVLGGLAAVVLLGVMIFKFTTRDGVVVVELESDNEIASVEVNGHDVQFSPDGNRRLRFQVDPGEHTLTLRTGDGVELTTSLGAKPLEIAAGKTVRLRAWVDRPGVATTEPPTGPSAAAAETNVDSEEAMTHPDTGERDSIRGDREYFMAIQALGGEAGFYATDDIMSPAVREASEPAGNAFRLVAPQRLDDTALLMKHPLVFLTFNGPAFGDAELSALSRLLQRRPSDFPPVNLKFFETSLTSEGLAALEGLRIGGLELRAIDLTPAGVDHLRRARVEQALGIARSGLGDDDIARLVKDAVFGTLHVPDNEVTGEGLRRIIGSSVTNLGVMQSDLSDNDLAPLEEITALTHLYLSGNPITDAGLQHLKPLTSLRALFLENTQVTASGIEQLHKMLSQCRITWNGGTVEPLQPVAGSDTPNPLLDPTLLDTVDRGERIRGDRDYFMAIQALGGVVVFYADEADMSPELREASEPDGNSYRLIAPERLDNTRKLMKAPLVFLHVEAESFGDEQLRLLAGILRQRPVESHPIGLQLVSTNITSAGLAVLDGLAIQTLEVDGVELTPAGIENIRRLNVSAALTLASTQLTDAGLSRLTEGSTLTWLHVPDNRVTGQGLRGLSGSNVTVLNIAGNNLSDDDLTSLDGIPSLTCLYLSNNPVSDAGLQHVKRLSSLTQLFLTGTQVTAAGVDDLHQALPLCRINWDGGTIEPLHPVAEVRGDRDYFMAIQALGGEVAFYATESNMSPELREASEAAGNAFRLIAPEKLNNTPQLMRAPLVFLRFEGEAFGDEELRRLAGILRQRPEESSPIGLQLFQTTVTSVGLAALDGLVMQSLQVDGLELTPDGIENIRRLKLIQTLIAGSAQLTDAGLSRLMEGSTLIWLHVPNNQVTGQGLRSLSGSNLTVLNVAGNNLSDDDLTTLEEIPSLTGLYLSDNPISDAGLQHVKRLSSLTQLFLTRTQVTAAGVENLHQTLPLCRIIWDGGTIEPFYPVAGVHGDRDYFMAIEALGGEVVFYSNDAEMSPALREASEPAGNAFRLIAPGKLDDAPQLMRAPLVFLRFAGKAFGDEELRGLAGILRQRPEESFPIGLQLIHTNVTSGGLAVLDGLVIKSLEVHGVELTPAGIENIRRLNVSQTLIVGSAQLTDAGLSRLMEDSTVTWLQVPNNQVTGQGLRSLVRSNLTLLNVAGNNLADDDLTCLEEIPSLTRLFLSDNPVGDAGLEHLKRLSSLTQLFLTGTQATAAGVKDLHQSLPECQIIWDGDTAGPQLTGQDFASAILGMGGRLHVWDSAGAAWAAVLTAGEVTEETLQARIQISFADEDRFENTCLRALGSLIRRRLNQSESATISLNGTGVTDDGLKALAGLNVSSLNLNRTQITDGGVTHLQAITGLVTVGLQGTRLTDDGLAELAKIDSLTNINISLTGVTPAGIDHLRGLALENLKVVGIGLGRKGVDEIAGLRSLLVLDLSGTGLTDENLAQLRELKSLVSLRIVGNECTQDAVERLHQSLPLCRIIWNGGTIEPASAGDEQSSPGEDANTSEVPAESSR